MSEPRTPPRGRSLRVRITLAFVATGVLLASTLSIATFLAARRFLEGQRIQASTDQTIIVLRIAREFFLEDIRAEPSDLVAQLQLRGDFEAIVTSSDDFFRSTLSLDPRLIPAGVQNLVEQERLAYQVTEPIRSGSRHARFLVFGAPLPPVSTDLYLFYPLDSVDQTMSVLARVLLVAGITVVIVAIGAAQRVAGRILAPVRTLSDAAQRAAEGLLETRVTPGSADEIGVLAASFNEMAGAFEEMLARERRFVADVSHELRTPLATLRATSEMLQAHRWDFIPSAREAVDLIAEDVANLQRLIEELMEVSEVDAGRAVLRWETVDLRALAAAVVARLRRDAPIEGDAVTTVSDKARLERILSNLIDNAYHHGGGRDVRVSVARNGTSCSVAVSDRGPGIPHDDLPRLFDRFYKTDASRGRERGGVGLGLAIAFENARLLGGALTAASEPGDGATFTLTIPARDVPPEEDA